MKPIEIIKETYALLESYKDLIELNDIQGLEHTKASLIANKGLIGGYLIDYLDLYKQAKRKYNINRLGYYKRYRGEGQSQADAENNSKLETIKDLEEMDNMFIKKEKCRVLLDDTTDCIINIQSTLKRLYAEEKYNM